MNDFQLYPDKPDDERIAIWCALSEFYLDTALAGYQLDRITQVFLDSNYSFENIQAIHKHEVFPVFIGNLWAVVGEWAFFDDDFVEQEITNYIQTSNWLCRGYYACMFRFNQGFFNHYWQEIMPSYVKYRDDPASFVPRNIEVPEWLLNESNEQ